MEWIKKIIGGTTFKQIAFFTLMAVVTIAASWIMFEHYPAFISFAVALALIDIALIKLWLADKFFLRDFDTLEELKNDNRAVGEAFKGICILIAVAMLCAFAVFY